MKKFILFIFFIFYSSIVICQNNVPIITNKNGKFGLIDEKGNVLIENSCDIIYSFPNNYIGLPDIMGTIRPFFILKNNNKYAYAIYSTKNYEFLSIKEDDSKWLVSDFIYDELRPYEFDNDFWLFTAKYRIKDKWGILYSKYSTVRDARLYIALPWAPDGFTKLLFTNAIYDSIGNRYEDGLIDVVKNNKYSLVYLSPPIEYIDFGDDFDTIPTLIYTGIKYFIPLIRMVIKNGKWGVVKLNNENKKIEYIVPCNYDTIIERCYQITDKKNDELIFLCENRIKHNITLYNINENKAFTVNTKYPTYNLLTFDYDTIPDNVEEINKKYAIVITGKYNKQTNEYKSKEQCLIDMENGKKRFYQDDKDTAYNIHIGRHGIVIEKIAKLEDEINYTFTDYETDSEIIKLKAKKNITYYTSYQHLLHKNYNKDYLTIETLKEINGEKEYSYKYYYDFRIKKIFKGRCKGC